MTPIAMPVPVATVAGTDDSTRAGGRLIPDITLTAHRWEPGLGSDPGGGSRRGAQAGKERKALDGWRQIAANSVRA